MTTPDNLRYSADHSWLRLEGKIVTVGITDYAQGEFSDVQFVELPDLEHHAKGAACAKVESVRTTSDLYAPVSGKIVEYNMDLVTDPSKVNKEPYAGGWIYKMQVDDVADVEALMESSSYVNLVR